MKDLKVGFALCGSFCTMKKAVAQMQRLKDSGADILPIMSPIAYSTDTRFGTADEFVGRIEDICSKPVIHTIKDAEPIGPKHMCDIMVIAPCTGNTMAKLTGGITDTSVTMAAKAHLRNGRPLVIAAATNDALSASAKNIGILMNTKNIYFVPMSQDDPISKPTSIIADFEQLQPALEAALKGEQLQPVYFS
jgi:dipicolinate synthase subunit B